ncbi:MAG: glycoside hydrolase family 44 protein [Myxococcota bacterium]
MIWLLVPGLAVGADELVYGEFLAPNWYNWSWTSTVDFEATGEARTGERAIFAAIESNGGLSIQRATGLGVASALRFYAKADGEGLVLRLESTQEGAIAPEIPLDLSTDAWTEVIVSLDALPAFNWNRISWVDTSGLAATVWVDDIELLDDDPNATGFRTVEPVPPNRLVLYGPGDASSVTVTVDGKPHNIVDTVERSGPTRTYLTLDPPLESGELRVTTADGTYTRRITTASVSVGRDVTHVIAPTVYGVNFPDWPPTDAVMDRYRYGAVRWGGNARALYNPSTRSTNVGADYFFRNVTVNPDLRAWSDLIDVPTVVTVPNLDWVADGTRGWQYSVEKYGPQEQTSPDEPDAGNGLQPDGTPILDNDPNDVSVPWSADDARDWLANLTPVPTMLAIGNETDIAHFAHQGVHPDPATYEEQLQRFLDYANAAKDALPNVDVTGPVGCCWFYYWNSGDPTDATNYGDFLPWFLDEVAKADATSGRRTLDVLDLHYYPENLIAFDWKNQSDEAIDAWRLRSTRSLWDPSFIDESYVGTEPPVTDQPNPDRVQWIPRMQALIDAHYPGTRLAISEWGFGDVEGPSGGLAAADALGILGREQVDWAFMWPGPPAGSPAAAAYELFRGGDLVFGNSSLEVSGFDPDRLGVYASQGTGQTVSIVIVNKSPDDDVTLTLDGLDAGRLEVEHFGATVGARVVEHPSDTFEGVVTVPAYTATLLVVDYETDAPPPPVPSDTGEPSSNDDSPVGPPSDGGRCAGCHLGGSSPLWIAIVFTGLIGVRRRH